MLILAIESSCDETAVALVESGWKVRANAIASSLDLHQKTGGVVPEVAARAHVESIIPVIEECLQSASCVSDDIDAIAVTSEPGLVTSLLIGTETAKWLSYLWNKPLISVNHIHGHVYANWLERDPASDPISFPVLCLSVSGGHNELIFMESHSNLEVMGESQDDAAGEAFDKVSRLLGLGYPGGPAIEKAALGWSGSEVEQLRFPRAWLNESNSDKWDGSSLNFSFSGLKSEVQREVEKKGKLTQIDQAEIAAAFQEAVCDVLVTKLTGAAAQHQAKEVHLAGGVSANKYLRMLTEKQLKETELDITLRWPAQMAYCTDNAAMIGAAAFWQKEK